MSTTLVPFADTAGGTLLLGVEDGIDHVRAVAEPVDVEDRLASLIFDRISKTQFGDGEALAE